MDIKEVKETVDLLVKYNDKGFVEMGELAKELGTRKVKVMAFVDENRKHFWLQERWVPKKRVVYKNYGWSKEKFREEITVRGKYLGKCIKKVYELIEHNPLNFEHVGYLKELYKKRIFVTEIDYYGVMGYQILTHTEPKDWEFYSERKDLYYNTKEKIQEIDNLITRKKQAFYFGGLGDSYSTEMDGVVTPDDTQVLIDNGWELNEVRPLGYG